MNQAPSWILYRAYLEDLTESGRTYAEVDAIDTAEYVKAFNPDGRYHDDLWTPPATLAP